MFNFNLDLKDADKILQSPFVLVLLFLIVISLSIMFGMSLASDDPKVICAEKVELINEQTHQINLLEAKHAKCVADGETSCIEREQRICREEKESIKINCNTLIDRIVKDRKK